MLNSLFYPEWNGATKISQRHGVKINVRSLALALKLEEHHCGTVDYAIVWDQPHCDADYPNEVCRWIQKTQEPNPKPRPWITFMGGVFVE